LTQTAGGAPKTTDARLGSRRLPEAFPATVGLVGARTADHNVELSATFSLKAVDIAAMRALIVGSTKW
jgi:hypothetical protein